MKTFLYEYVGYYVGGQTIIVAGNRKTADKDFKNMCKANDEEKIKNKICFSELLVESNFNDDGTVNDDCVTVTTIDTTKRRQYFISDGDY